MRFHSRGATALLLLCTALAGAAIAEALPPSHRGLLRGRRALAEADEYEEPVAPYEIATLTFNNTCKDYGVDFRTVLIFDGQLDWFAPNVTDYIPGPFVDYFCDNVGAVNYQFEGPENKSKDPATLAKIASGVCFNAQVMLRWPGWSGHGPQATLGLEFPAGAVTQAYVALNDEDGVAQSAEAEGAVTLAVTDADEVLFMTADFSQPCNKGEAGCVQWARINMDSLEPQAVFTCAPTRQQGKKDKEGA